VNHDWTPDQRDFTKDPPALLDPEMILEVRRILPKAILGTLPPWPYDLTPKKDEEMKQEEMG
jgi:hypothetical protein